MSSIYIHGMKMPTEDEVSKLVIITCDGRAVVVDGPHRHISKAISVPDHGRLIDADALLSKDYQIYRLDGAAIGRRNLSVYDIQEAPTIIEVNKE